jgi:metal-sulfur cluster biosynthetic enzyme/DNA-binding MarR family transcriptional regulator/N-acetylglutamate synthase-like GNAT family acetyltransferase
MIEQVRRFNRTVTQRIGALDDAFLSRDRPLGQARLLWEIRKDGSDVRRLRARLDLDSGYVSRLLRSLESDGLIVVQPSDADGRVRTARLTSRGQAEQAELDRLSDDAAAAILEPLSARQRDRLIDAMAEVERLLAASAVRIAVRDPRHPDARRAVQAFLAELSHRFEEGFDPGRGISATDEEVTPPQGLFLLATLHAEPVGCGVLKFHGDAPAHIKRMWVAASVRGLGLGRRLLAELEAQAAAHGVRVLRLETNRALSEAISLYRTAGYREVEAFNDEPYAHHWFEKTIGAELWVLPSGTSGADDDDMSELPSWARDALAGVYDPCCQEKGISVIDMGLVRSIEVEDGIAKVELLLTSGWCPFAATVLTQVQDQIRRAPGIRDADVSIVWDEAWTTDRLSPRARSILRFLPPPSAVPDRDAYIAAHSQSEESPR